MNVWVKNWRDKRVEVKESSRNKAAVTAAAVTAFADLRYLNNNKPLFNAVGINKPLKYFS
jgi:hypothetical protein